MIVLFLRSLPTLDSTIMVSLQFNYWKGGLESLSIVKLVLFRLTKAQFRLTINNYWMRLSMISCIIKTKVCVICQSRRLRQITQTQGFDNS